jgi:hypothetical protein
MSAPLSRRVWSFPRGREWRILLFALLYRLGYRRLYVLRRSLEIPLPEEITTGLPVTIEWLGVEQAEEYRAFRKAKSNIDPRVFFEAGDRCLVARHEGRLVAAMWGSHPRAFSRWLGRAIPLGPTEGHQFDTFTDPLCRGQTLAPALSRAWLVQWISEGKTAVIRTTVPENVASLRSCAKVGYEVVGLIRGFRLGPWSVPLPYRPISPSEAQQIQDGWQSNLGPKWTRRC